MPEDCHLLWKQFRSGDEKSLEGIFILFHKELFRYGFKIARSQVLVDDSMQDLFMELWQNRAGLSDPLSVKAYLYRALKYKLIRSLKKESVVTAMDNREDDFTEFSYENVLIRREEISEQHRNLIKHMAQLSPRQQEAIYLRFFGQLSYDEISSIMSISAQGAMNLVFKAIKYLRQNLVKIVMMILSLSTAQLFTGLFK